MASPTSAVPALPPRSRVRGPSRQTPVERREQARRGGRLAEVIEHEDGAPDRAARVRDALTGDVGRRAVHRLEQRRHVAARAEVGARRHAHAALQGGAEVGQDVAEEVGGDDHVEAVGAQHHARRERVHEHALVADAGMARGHLGGDLVPEHVAVARGVRLGRARDQRRAARAASANACSTTRSMPARVNTAVSMPTSLGWPWCTRPPTPEYSPSEFSRTNSMSTSPGARPARAHGTPSSSRTGRTLAHRSSRWRIGSSRPQSVT